jgi:Family of unknown function (DUF6502)
MRIKSRCCGGASAFGRDAIHAARRAAAIDEPALRNQGSPAGVAVDVSFAHSRYDQVVMAEPVTDVEPALHQAMVQLLAPMARLAVERGLKFPQVQELLKQAFVAAARAAQPDQGPRDIGRVATMAGLTRREVTRLSQRQPPARAEKSSPATQVFTRWVADRRLRDSRGRPRTLPRTGPAPSFEALARSVTRDVHPRRLLDELLRLGLVSVNERTDAVRLVKDAFVPREGDERLVAFVGHNVGDHLAASVANVLGDERRHFEQALFVDELSDASVDVAKKLVQAQWRALTAALVPELEDLLTADRRSRSASRNKAHGRRLRVGLYSFDETMAGPPAEVPADE